MASQVLKDCKQGSGIIEQAFWEDHSGRGVMMECGARLEAVGWKEEKYVHSRAHQEAESTGLGGRTSGPLSTSQA